MKISKDLKSFGNKVLFQRTYGSVLGIFLCLILWLCGTFLPMVSCSSSASKDSRIHVTVSVPPQAYIANRIGADYISTMVMIPKAFNPHTYEPTPQQLIQINQSDVYIKVGVSSFTFETRLFDVLSKTNPSISVVDMAEGVDTMTHLESYDRIDTREGNALPSVSEDYHSMEQHPEHSLDELDPHIWTSPKAVLSLAKKVYDTFVRLDPTHKDAFKVNYDALVQDIEQLDRELKSLFADKQGTSFLVYHPSWGYFAKEYGLHQISIEFEGKEPSAQHLEKVIRLAQAKQIKVIFIQSTFPKRIAESIAHQLEARILEINPLEENWMENIQRVAHTFKEVLR